MVSGSAAVHAHLGVEYAENGVLVDGVAAIAVGSRASNTAAVSGSAAVRVRHNLAATGSAAATGAAAARPRHTIAATQAVGTGDSVANVRATYRLSATQAVEVASTVIARPVVSLDAEQSVDTIGVASSVPSVGTIDVDAAQSLEVSGVATVRVRHSLAATQTVTVVESATRDAIRVPGAGAQSVAVDGSAAVRARYSLIASQSVGVAGTARATPALTAAGSAMASGSGATRPRHTLEGASAAAVSGSATAAARTFAPQRINKVGDDTNPGFNSANVLPGWSSDSSEPATIVSNALIVQGATTAAAVRFYFAATTSGFNGASLTFRLRRNGSVVDGLSVSRGNSGPITVPRPLAFDGAVAQGDAFDVTTEITYGTNTVVVAASTYLRVAQQ